MAITAALAAAEAAVLQQGPLHGADSTAFDHQVREKGMPACWSDPRFAAAKERVAAACKASGVTAGIWNGTSNDGLRAAVAQGFGLMVIDADILAMSSNLAKGLEEKDAIRKEVGVA